MSKESEEARPRHAAETESTIIAQTVLRRKVAAGERGFDTDLHGGTRISRKEKSYCRKKRKKVKKWNGKNRFDEGSRRDDTSNHSETSAALRLCVRFDPLSDRLTGAYLCLAVVRVRDRKVFELSGS
jgi:hypothetical protein